MRIIFFTDIHGSFNDLHTLLTDTVADVYIVAGDLIDIPFYNMETAIRYHELQNYFTSLRRRMEQEDMILEEFVENLMEMPHTSDEVQEKGSKYQQYTIRARRVMQQKYKVLENIFCIKSDSRIYVLPGNYDMDMKFTSLHERDLHLHWYQIGTLKIAGYGGADVWTGGIPEKYIVRYNASIGIDDRKNEMYTFFKAIRPNIVVTHQPPHGIHDRISYRGPSGSPALRNFLENYPVQLSLSGHIHSDWGFHAGEHYVHLNPSNFGEVITPSGDVSEGGFFYQIEMDEKRIEGISFRKLVEERIYDIAQYTPTEDGWKEEVLDRERFDARMRMENYDLVTDDYIHIPEIELFKDIKKYFKLFQTRETEDRVDNLERAIDLMKGTLKDVAMDLVGSVNVGLSGESSDIDIVLYIRCGNSECYDTHAGCETLETTKKKIRENLEDHYDFEIIDCIDLDALEEDIRSRNFESEIAMRFLTYRAICRPINYKVIAPYEDMLNRDPEFKKELEGSVQAYLKIFATTSTHIKSFEKYESRLRAIGIKIPGYVRKKIKEYLQGREI
jgi:Icc-related predicted phosphoesterase